MTIRSLVRRRGTRTLLVLVTMAAALLSATGVASAYWSATGHGSGTDTTGTLRPPTGVTVPSSSTGAVPVSWTQPAATPQPTGYYVLRVSGGTTVAACATSPTATITATSCTDSSVPVGTYTYRVVSVFRSWTATSADSAAVTVAAAATKLVFTSAPIAGAATASATIGPITVQERDAANNPVLATGTGTTVALSSSSTGTVRFAATSGGTAVTSVTIPAGSSVATFYYGDTLQGSPSVTATTSFATASQTETVSPAAAAKFVITSGPVTGTAAATATLGPITVARQDAFGNAVTTGTTAVNLASNSAGAAVFSTSSGGSAVTSVTIGAGASSASFFYGDTRKGTPTVTASGALTSATQQETITAGAATRLAWTGVTVSAGTVSNPCLFTCTVAGIGNFGTFTASVSVTDSFGNVVSDLGAARTVTVSSTAGGGTFTSPTTGSAVTLTVPAAGPATSTATFTFKAENGNWTSDGFAAASSGLTGATASVTKQ